MTNKKLKKLKRQVEEIELKNAKLMWKHANWQWRTIIILGVIFAFYIFWKIGTYI